MIEIRGKEYSITVLDE